MNTSSAGAGNPNRSEPSVPELDAGRFELLEVIGQGGMGTVHRAVQRSVGRYVAVKTLSPDHSNASGLSRFVREANAIARLTHPNIVQLIDFGRDSRSGNILLVMELLEGESLRAHLRSEGRLGVERAVFVAVQCLNALRAAHAAGVIHRDLKPENIFLHRAGDDDHVKVLDFGVAKLSDHAPSDDTNQGALVGTLRYMAPEQIAGENPDARIDVYAMGMVVYEMLAGTLPYDTRDRFVLLRQILSEEPRPLLSVCPHCPPALAEQVHRAIQKGASARHPSVEEFRRALLPFLGGDHARLQALAESASGRLSSSFGNGGEIRSGVVPSGSGILKPRAEVPTSAERPAALAAMGYPSAPSGPQGFVSSGVTPPATSAPMAPYASAPPPPPRRWPMVIAALGLCSVVVGLVALHPWSRDEPPPTSVASRPVVSTPLPTVPSTPTAPTEPTAPPALAPTPRPAMRMVLVATTPPGARVSDAQSGDELCPRTPCAVPVPVDGSRLVRIQREAVSLDARLDPAAPSVQLDLAAAAAPSRASSNGRRPTNGDHRRGEGRPRGGGDELPMFLPHSGH